MDGLRWLASLLILAPIACGESGSDVAAADEEPAPGVWMDAGPNAHDDPAPHSERPASDDAGYPASGDADRPAPDDAELGDAGEANPDLGSPAADDAGPRDAADRPAAWVSAEGTVRISCANPTSGTALSIGSRTLYFGYEQVSPTNQDPVVALYDAEEPVWCRRHEQQSPDGRATTATWDGGEFAYVTFTVAGGGSALDDAAEGWLGSYAPGAFRGGGAVVSVVARIGMSDGAIQDASFVIAVLQSGRVNTLRPESAVVVREDRTVEFRGRSAYAPLNPDRTRMNCAGPTGFAYRLRLSPDLSSAVCASVEDESVEGAPGQNDVRTCEATLPCRSD